MTLATMLAPGAAMAGEYLKPAQLATKAAAIAVVQVTFTRANQKASITLVRSLRAPISPAEIKPDPSTWLSQCLADRKDLKHWLHRFPKQPARKLWRAALIREFAAGLHEVEQGLLDDEVPVQAVALGEPVEFLLRGRRDRR
jgi:hypothetical protein